MPSILDHEAPRGWVTMDDCLCDNCTAVRHASADPDARAGEMQEAQRREARDTLRRYFREGTTVDTVTTYPRRGEGRPSVLVLFQRNELSRWVAQALEGLETHRYRGGVIPRNVTAPFPGRDLIAELSTALYGRPNALKQRAVSRPWWLS